MKLVLACSTPRAPPAQAAALEHTRKGGSMKRIGKWWLAMGVVVLLAACSGGSTPPPGGTAGQWDTATWDNATWGP